MLKMYAVAKFTDNLIDRLLLLVFTLMTLLGIYVILDSAYVFNNASGSKILPTRFTHDELEEVIKVLTKDYVAWLSIDDTEISYPIMYYEDNEKYLNLDPYGEYSIAGSIFLDYRNSPDFTDRYSLVYGHHMSHGFMFGALDDFEDEEYFNNHRTGTLTYRGTEYPLNIFGFSILDALDENLFDPLEYEGNMYEYIDSRNILNKGHGDGPILALSTCRDPGQTIRTVVFCEILEPKEEVQ